MSLCTLPSELVLHTAIYLDEEHDIAALVRTSRRLYQLLNPELYRNNIQNKGSAGFLCAAQKGYVEGVKQFLAHGAAVDTEISCRNENGIRTSSDKATALDCASSSRHPEVVGLLLDAGADPNHWLQKNSGTHDCPLYWALYFRDPAVATLLLTYGAKLSTTAHKQVHYALSMGPVELARVLLDHGVDVDTRDYEGETPLFRVVWMLHEGDGYKLSAAGTENLLAILSLLLEKGGTPRKQGAGHKPRDVDFLRSVAGHSNSRVREMFGLGKSAEHTKEF